MPRSRPPGRRSRSLWHRGPMDARSDAALHAHHARGEERERLAQARGLVEFERTKELLLRRLPDPPSVVADIGGGPGRYSLWLAGRGHRVEHRDLVPLHVEQLRSDAGNRPAIHTAVGDARHLDLGDAAVDAVLLLGPLYHLRRRADRLRALRESRPVLRELVDVVERTGWMPPLAPDSFSAYCHRPGQLRAELRAAGLQVVDLVSVEGLAFTLDDLEERMADPLARGVVLEAARALERVPELLGIGPHLLATAIRDEGRGPAAA